MPKPNLPTRSAEDTVFDNLGLDRADLGLDTGSGVDEGSGWEGDDGSDQGDGADEQQRQPDRQAPDDGDGEPRVIHTRPLPERAEVKADKNGNLLNKNGEIVARAGREARMYQNLHKTKAEAKTLKGQIDDLNGRLQRAVQIGRGFHTELQTLKATSEAIKQFGLDQTEHLSALRLFKDLKDNPANAIKNLLTRAAANGINVQELGGPAGADPKSIVDLIRQELSPLKERTEQERKNAEAAQAERAQRERIQGEVNSFFAQNPEAQQYLPVFTSTMKQYPGMTLGEIWARIQLHFAQNPQDRRSKNSRGQAPRSLPSGRGAPVNSANDMAPVSDSYDAIVRDVMTKAGIS